MRLEIYSKSDVLIGISQDVVYTSNAMGERNLTVKLNSSIALPLEIGSYADYKGERFYIKKLPCVDKVASSGTTGNSFQYTIIFNSIQSELNECLFLDYVLDSDNYYTGQSTVSFFGDVYDLARRIQANLDRKYGAGVWTILMPMIGETTPQNIKSISMIERSLNSASMTVSISSSSCWDALTHAYSDFKFFFYVVGRTITIGVTKPDVNTKFSYGVNNGLYKIQRSIDSDSQIITRLYVTGGTKNIPENYLRIPQTFTPYDPKTTYYCGSLCSYSGSNYKYDNIYAPSKGVPPLGTDGNLNTGWITFTGTGSGRYFPSLMLPYVRQTLQNSIPTDYLDSSLKDEYGIIEGSINFDDIFPTIQNNINYFDAEAIYVLGYLCAYGSDGNGGYNYFKYVNPNPTKGNVPDLTGTDKTYWEPYKRNDEILSVGTITDGYTDNSPNLTTRNLSQPYFSVFLRDVGFNINDYNTLSDQPLMVMQDGACGGYQFQIYRAYNADSTSPNYDPEYTTYKTYYDNGAVWRYLLGKNTTAESSLYLPSGSTGFRRVQGKDCQVPEKRIVYPLIFRLFKSNTSEYLIPLASSGLGFAEI